MSSISQLYDQAFATDNLEARLNLLLEGERLLSHLHDEWLFLFREAIAITAKRVGRPELCITAFTKCLAEVDINPKLAPYLDNVMLLYDDVLVNVARYPQMTLEQIQNLVEDFRKRIINGGYSIGNYYSLESRVAFVLGDQKKSYEWTLLRLTAKKDQLSATEETEINHLIYRHAGVRDWAEVLRQAEPYIQGKLPHSSTFICTSPMIAKAFFYTGDLEEAIRFNDKGVQGTVGKIRYFEETHELLENYARMDSLQRGIDLLERRSSWLSTPPNPFDQYRFYCAAVLLLEKALAANPRLKLRLSSSFSKKANLRDDRAETAMRYFLEQARPLAMAFNKRNGNTYWTDFYELKDFPGIP